MAMNVLRNMPLSEVDFVGLEEEDLPRTDEPIDVLACVIEYEIKRLQEIEKAIEKRKEEGFHQPVPEFKGTGATSRMIEKKKESKPKREKSKVEQVFLVSDTDRSMKTRASARAIGKSVLVNEDVQDWQSGSGPARTKSKRVLVEEVQLSIRRTRSRFTSVLVDEEDMELSLSIGRRRTRANRKSVNGYTTDIGEDSSSRFVEDTTDAFEKMDIGKGSSRWLSAVVEATGDALENSEEGSSSSLLGAQVTKGAESSKSRKRSKKQSKKPEKKPRVEVYRGPDPPPALPDFFREMITAMGGVNPVLVLQKALFKTDVANQQNRLSIPVRAVNTAFLTDEEKAILDAKDAIETVFLDTKGKRWIMPLRLWDMKKQTGKKGSKILALTSPWYTMARDEKNNLVTGDVVQLWTFRISEKLGFALVKLENDRVDD